MSTQFYFLESTQNITPDYRKVFSIKDHDLLLLQHEGKLYLLDNICPHAGYPMQQGIIIDNTIRCSMHGYLFDLDSGQCTYSTEGPCRALRTFTLERRGDSLGVML